MQNIESETFSVDDEVEVVNTKPLPGNTVAPPLKEEEVYTVERIYFDKQGNQHLDVGLKSEYEYISSYETGEWLPQGHKIHWCHPSRFKKRIKENVNNETITQPIF